MFKKSLVIGLLLISIILGSSYGYYIQSSINEPEYVVELKPLHKINAALRVQAYGPDGKLKGQAYINDDLILNNFRNFLASFFKTVIDADSTCSLTDTGGTGRTIATRKESASTTGPYTLHFLDTLTGAGNKGGIIAIGTGNAAPALTDYNLTTLYGSYHDLANAPTWDSTSGNVTISESVAITSTETITEAGYGVNWVDTGGTVRQILLFRNTFTGISVENLDTVAITYWITLNDTGFTNNFGIMLSEIFASVADSQVQAITHLNDTSGTSRHIEGYEGVAGHDGTFANYVLTAGTMASYMEIGTGNNPPARNQYALQTKVESSTAVLTPVLFGSTLVIQTNIACTGARTVTEAAFFMRFSNDDDFSFMLWRDTFAGVAISAGHAAHITFVITM